MKISKDIINSPLHKEAQRRFKANPSLILPFLKLLTYDGGLDELYKLLGLHMQLKKYKKAITEAIKNKETRLVSFLLIEQKSYLHGQLDAKYP